MTDQEARNAMLAAVAACEAAGIDAELTLVEARAVLARRRAGRPS